MRYLLFSIIVAASLCACGTDKEEAGNILTQNAWRWDVQAIKDSISHMQLAQSEYDVIMASLKRMETGVFEFRKDKSMSLTIQGEERVGTWELKSGGKVLAMALPNIAIVDNVITSIEPGRFVLAADKPQGILFAKIFVPMEKSNVPPKVEPADTTGQQQ